MDINIFKRLTFVAITQLVSRSGTVYLHSLLDNHPEVATIPPIIDITCFYNKENLTTKEYFDIFEKSNLKFFNTSQYTLNDNKHSMIFRLGEKKNSKIITNKKIFKKIFFDTLNKLDKNPKNAIIALYYVYTLMHCKSLSKLKIILFHPHEKKIHYFLINFLKKHFI